MISVSVIVPCYNMEEYVDRCMTSLLNQTLENIEIILVNDASQDNTLEILKRYEEQYENVIVIDSRINLKQGGARNLGMDTAKGKYIGFVDPDDWIDETMYEKLYQIAEEKNCEIVKCYLDRVQELFDNVGDLIVEDDIVTIDSSIEGNITVYAKGIESRHSGFGVCDAIFKRELLLENKLRFPENIFCEDSYFRFFTDYFAPRQAILEEVLYYYFFRKNSTTNISGAEELLASKLLLLKDITDRGFLDSDKDSIEAYFINRYYHSIYISVEKDTDPPIETLTKLSNFMLKHFPNYQNNKHYLDKSGANEFVLRILKLNDMDPSALWNLIQEDKSIKKIMTLNFG